MAGAHPITARWRDGLVLLPHTTPPSISMCQVGLHFNCVPNGPLFFIVAQYIWNRVAFGTRPSLHLLILPSSPLLLLLDFYISSNSLVISYGSYDTVQHFPLYLFLYLILPLPPSLLHVSHHSSPFSCSLFLPPSFSLFPQPQANPTSTTNLPSIREWVQ